LDEEEYFGVDSLVRTALMTDSLQSSILLLKAKSQMAQHKYKETVATVKKILEWNDTQAIHARLLGISYFQLKDYEKTIECMSFLILSGVKGEWVFYYLGASYRELGDIPKSIDWMNKAIESGISENIEIYYSQLAKSYEDAKDYKNAIHYYQAAYEKSKTKILLYHLARNYDIYFKDKSSAIGYYKRYLASDDTIKLAREYAKRRLSVLE
jgi:tetratricopeptide (TPR) repeat protein